MVMPCQMLKQGITGYKEVWELSSALCGRLPGIEKAGTQNYTVSICRGRSDSGLVSKQQHIEIKYIFVFTANFRVDA
jgi:hypothetical protein